jgi:hypothetical protein
MSNSTSELVLSASTGLQAVFRYRIGKVRVNDRIQEPAREALALSPWSGTRNEAKLVRNWSDFGGLALDKPPKGLTCDQCPKPNGLRYWRWGGRRNAVQTDKATSVEKCLKMPQNPQRPVHALLGGLFAIR